MAEDDTRILGLLDEQEIRGVLMRLARGTDRHDGELIRSCYHEDAFDDHGAFQGTPAEFAEWVPKTLAMFKCTMHVLGNISIEIDDARRQAFCETYCTAHHVFPPDDAAGERNAIMGLRYVDRFERRGEGGWLIARRVCAYEYAHIVAPSEAWPLDPPFITGRRGTQDPSYAR